MPDRAHVGAFDGASDYDRHAAVQRQVAHHLAEQIRALPLPPSPRILEVGCGTGFLGEALLPILPQARWVMSDIAPAMLDRARQRLAGRGDIDFRVMDGEHPDVAGPFDVICSSLALQWFGDLAAGLRRLAKLLAPGGVLVFSTMADGSFADWRAAHGGGACGIPSYPSADALRAMGLTVTPLIIAMDGDAMAFLRHLRGIGAQTPQQGYAPLSARQMREVMQRYDQAQGRIEYRIALCQGTARSIADVIGDQPASPRVD